MTSEVRKRAKGSNANVKDEKGTFEKELHLKNDDMTRPTHARNSKDTLHPAKSADKNLYEISSGTYWLTRVLYLRYLAFIYCVAFSVALNQNKQLIGRNGLLPVQNFMKQLNEHFGDNGRSQFLAVPSLMLFIDVDHVDWYLDALTYLGLALGLVILITGSSNIIMMLVLWMLYHSLVNIGQRWYSFGWESQLLETGFLAILFCPLFTMQKYPEHTPPSFVAIYGNRWLIFRIMIGAGLIKIRGDKCWRDLTCMNYHYQTQPVPNPISYFLHQSPEIIHMTETLGNHFIELVAPFFMLLTRPFRIAGGIIQIAFQVTLIISGNLSFLNWLTILPSLCCFDDRFLLSMFPASSARKKVAELQNNQEEKASLGSAIRKVYEIMVALLIAYLSIPVVKNLLSSNQAMNTSFDSFRIVNTYGAFGSITKTRTEVIFQGTRNRTIIPDQKGGIWQEYEFKCKPGDVKRRPCLISPYHYRLDWLMWFAAFQNYQYNPWLVHFAAKLLANRKEATDLIEHNPFADGKPPRYIRAEHYIYEFTKIGSKEAKQGQWWKRRRIKEYLPIIDLHSVAAYLKSNGWVIPKIEE